MAPGPDPAAPARIMVWEWDPGYGRDLDGPGLHHIGTDDFTAFAGMTHGAIVAIGDFE